jgi:hypothetical protein
MITWDSHRLGTGRIKKSFRGQVCADRELCSAHSEQHNYAQKFLERSFKLSWTVQPPLIINHVFRRDSLAGYQPAILLFQTKVRFSIPRPVANLTSTEPQKRRTSAATNTMSPVSATDNPALSQTRAMQQSVNMKPLVLFTCTSKRSSAHTRLPSSGSA